MVLIPFCVLIGRFTSEDKNDYHTEDEEESYKAEDQVCVMIGDMQVI